MAKVSILMNGYNSELYLEEAINSIYNQTYLNWEIIFIDNCSTDSTYDIIKSYDNKIKYYKTERNIPLGEARNYGLSKCNGEYIAFLDTDDIWLFDKLEKQVHLMDLNSNFQLSYGGVIYIDDNSEVTGKLLPSAKSGNVFSQQLMRYEINMQSVLIRNNIELKFNESMSFSPDYDLFMKLTSQYEALVISEPITKYRRLTNSLTSQKIDRWWIEIKQTLDYIFNKNKELINIYPLEYENAYAKVAYNKAQYLLSINDKSAAKKELSKYKFLNIKYFILYTLSFLPDYFWNLAHKFK